MYMRNIHGRVRMQISYERTCLYTTCHIMSYVWADRHVSSKCVHYDTCSCACSHTKRRVCAHFFDLRSHVYTYHTLYVT